jgi:energy-converting hydrogenase Eha subunit C
MRYDKINYFGLLQIDFSRYISFVMYLDISIYLDALQNKCI